MDSRANMKYAFIDECGNFGTDPNIKGNSSHFIITAIIIDSSKYEEMSNQVEAIRKMHFQTGEMKSSKVASDHPRRFKIIHSLLELDFKIVSVIINKKLLHYNKSGLRFKKVYYKFLNNVIHSELKLLYPNIKIIADEHGSNGFMNEFTNYIKSKGQLSIFDNFEFEFRSSNDEVLIQVADLICGTMALGFEEARKCSEYNSFRRLLDDKILTTRMWPINSENYLVNLDMITKSDYDKVIAEVSIRTAVNYISINRKSRDPIILDRIYVLEYLLNQIYCGNTKKYFYSDQLIKHICSQNIEEYNKHTFISNIIAPLRDSNVLLASGNRGYKLPMNEIEIYSYANKSIGQIVPMLKRLEKARNRLLAATDNKFDILDKSEYTKIKKYFDE